MKEIIIFKTFDLIGRVEIFKVYQGTEKQLSFNRACAKK